MYLQTENNFSGPIQSRSTTDLNSKQLAFSQTQYSVYGKGRAETLQNVNALKTEK